MCVCVCVCVKLARARVRACVRKTSQKKLFDIVTYIQDVSKVQKRSNNSKAKHF